MTTQPRTQVCVTHRFDASPERVFDAWLDPKNAGRWLFHVQTGEMVRVEIDPRVGGAFRFVDRRDGDDIEHTGKYVEVSRPRRLVFDFSVPKFSSENTRVSIDIVPQASGCNVTLTHNGVYADYQTRTEKGWGMILDALADVLSSDRG